MAHVIPVATVAILLGLAAYLVNWVLRTVTRSYDRPGEIPETKWSTFTESFDQLARAGRRSGILLGILERWLFFGAFLIGAPALIPGWMVVTVATKWQAWTGLFESIPADYPGYPLPQVKRYIRWRVSQRFLIGNILNVLLAGAAYCLIAALR